MSDADLMISTHAPRTGSDGYAGRVQRRKRTISTHAPRTGSDIKSAWTETGVT